MRTLSFPALDEARLYDRIKNHRSTETASVLDRLKSDILSAYSEYRLDRIGQLTSIIDDADVADSLRSNYTVLRSGALASEGAQILSRSRFCCLCGLRAASELDHFLPKKLFPEFAAYSANLVPVCGTCNKSKGPEYKDSNNGLLFIHAYLNDLPLGEKFLQAVLTVNRTVIPSFSIVPTPGISFETFAVLSAQFSYFNIARDYEEEGIELLAEKSGAIEEYFVEGGTSSVRKYLARDARSAENRYGLNHWKSALFRAASESDDFCAGGFRRLS